MKLDGKVALVSGGSRGIGRAIALAFAREGAHCALGYLTSETEAREVAAAIEGIGRRALAVQADISELSGVERLFTGAMDCFGRIDVLVANAGIITGASFFDLTEEDYDRVLDTNLKSHVFLCQKVVALMKRQGGGVIIQVSSVAGLSPELTVAEDPGYVVSKAGQIALTRFLARRLGPCGIRVNAIAPAIILPGMRDAFTDPELQDRLRGGSPLGKLGAPSDVADLAVYLACEDSAYLTGETISLSGGRVMH